MTGQTFGRLTVREKTGRRTTRSVLWLCDCACGNTHPAALRHLRSGNTRSCGCLPKGRQTYDLAGQKFACMTVTRHAFNGESGAVWWVKTDCGIEQLRLRKTLLRATRGCRKKECHLK